MNFEPVLPDTAYERIRHMGGHIGLGIRPSWRGIGPLHIHCHKDNPASARMILRNGGVLESEVIEPGSDQIVQRFLLVSAA